MVILKSLLFIPIDSFNLCYMLRVRVYIYDKKCSNIHVRLYIYIYIYIYINIYIHIYIFVNISKYLLSVITLFSSLYGLPLTTSFIMPIRYMFLSEPVNCPTTTRTTAPTTYMYMNIYICVNIHIHMHVYFTYVYT
jgi:hypothetical protein